MSGGIVAFVIAHGLAQDLFEMPLDYTLSLAKLLQKVLNIPNTTMRTAIPATPTKDTKTKDTKTKDTKTKDTKKKQ